MLRTKQIDPHYVQYAAHPRGVKYPGNRRGDGQSRWTPGRNTSQSRSPGRSPSRYYDDQRERLRSPFPRQRRGAELIERTRNPNIRRRRDCYGCGSPHHILSDNKCTTSLESIKTSVVDKMECSGATVEDMEEQIFNLHVATNSMGTETQRREQKHSQQVHFQESM